MSFEDTNAYYKMFLCLGEVVEKKSGKKILWRHLHRTGWSVATMDADKAQLNGKYLLYTPYI